MSRYTERRRRGSLLSDRRVVVSAAGMLAVVAAVTLLPQSSDAAPDDTAQLAAASGVNCQPIATSPAAAKGSRLWWQRQQQRQRQQQAGCASASASPSGGQNAGQNGGQNAGGQSGGQNTGQNGGAAATATGSAQAGNGGQANNGGQAGNGGQANNGGQAGNGGQGAEPLPAGGTNPADTSTPSVIVNPTSNQQPVGQAPADGNTTPLDILGNNCDKSKLQPHTGFQDGNRCVTTEFGEVGTADKNPSLIIASAPRFARANQAFDLRVNTRNLVRDRFLAAAKGGYYKESSFLTADGLVRGHFHTACRMLTSRTTAPDPAPAPAFFAATEDGAGGSTPDTVTVRVTGLPPGEAQCAVWAGDGSHRVPMMQRANQIPAFDVVRISVR